MSFYNTETERFVISLDDLVGTTCGIVALPIMVSSRVFTEYNVDDLHDITSLYEDIINFGFAKDHVAILNKEVLLLLWSTLNISSERRFGWEMKFPELLHTSGLTSIRR